jgi:hypothetical protein
LHDPQGAPFHPVAEQDQRMCFVVLARHPAQSSS